MNTANLQLEGLLVAISSILDVMKRKGLLTQQDIDEALDTAEAVARTDPQRPEELSPANVDAIYFPIRFLRHATQTGEGAQMAFAEVTARVGRDDARPLTGT
jgi:hypothetical protein